MTFERSNVQAMMGYKSGEQSDQSEIIKLNTNENPYPPSPAVAEALANIAVEDLRRYPPPTAAPLQNSIASFHDLKAENIIVTNGGDELLRLLITTFVEEDESIGVAEPSYTLYEVLAASQGRKYLKFALNEDWSVAEDFAKELNSAGVKLCFLVNPNAPSGVLSSIAEVRKLADEFEGVLVLDEAYVNFIDPALGYDSMPLIKKCDNIIILRTFSKGYSLAGLRMAYGIGAEALIDPMQYKTKDSYNTDLIAQQLAQAAIEDDAYANTTWERVIAQRSVLADALSKLGFSCPDSQSNFLLATVPQNNSAEQIYLSLKERGILIRFFSIPDLKDKLRITVGTEAENTQLIKQLSEIINS